MIIIHDNSKVKKKSTCQFNSNFLSFFSFLLSLFILNKVEGAKLERNKCEYCKMKVTFINLYTKLHSKNVYFLKTVVIIHDINFTILYNCVALSPVTLLCMYHHVPSSESFHLHQLKLYPLDTVHAFIPSAPAHHYSIFCLDELVNFRYPI